MEHRHRPEHILRVTREGLGVRGPAVRCRTRLEPGRGRNRRHHETSASSRAADRLQSCSARRCYGDRSRESRLVRRPHVAIRRRAGRMCRRRPPRPTASSRQRRRLIGRRRGPSSRPRRWPPPTAPALRAEADRLIAAGQGRWRESTVFRKAVEAAPTAKNHGDFGGLLYRLTAFDEAALHLRAAARARARKRRPLDRARERLLPKGRPRRGVEGRKARRARQSPGSSSDATTRDAGCERGDGTALSIGWPRRRRGECR